MIKVGIVSFEDFKARSVAVAKGEAEPFSETIKVFYETEQEYFRRNPDVKREEVEFIHF